MNTDLAIISDFNDRSSSKSFAANENFSCVHVPAE